MIDFGVSIAAVFGYLGVSLAAWLVVSFLVGYWGPIFDEADSIIWEEAKEKNYVSIPRLVVGTLLFCVGIYLWSEGIKTTLQYIFGQVGILGLALILVSFRARQKLPYRETNVSKPKPSNVDCTYSRLGCLVALIVIVVLTIYTIIAVFA